VLEGTVIGRCMQRHRHAEFIRFLNTVERAVPGRLLAEARTTCARSTYLRDRLRSDAIACNRFLSSGLSNTHTVCAMPADSHIAPAS
jgi:hypothetical protein